MKALKDKLQLIYRPYLIIAICFIAGYTFLHWLLFIKTAFIPLKQEIITFWLAFALPWIPVLIWLRPRIKLLTFKNENASSLMYLIASLAITFPTIVAQEYLITATGKLTALDNVSHYEKREVTRYYSIKNYFINKKDAQFNHTVSVSGKNNQTLNLLVYVALPILNSAADTANPGTGYFLGKKYSKGLSNSLSQDEKSEAFKSFAEETAAEFDTTNFQQFLYLEKMAHSDDHDELTKAVKESGRLIKTEPVIFTARFEPYEDRNGGKFGWIFKAFGIGSFVLFLLLLFPKFDETALGRFKEGSTTTVEDSADLKETFQLLVPRDGFFVTPILMNLNILVYIVMVVAGLGVITFKGVDLVNWGGNYGPFTRDGQWWRLLTSTFLHGGLIHLIANMCGLLFVGIFLEPLLGRWRYAMVYLATGMLASLTSLWWHTATVSIGASGAIFGLYGLFLALILFSVFPKQVGKAFLLGTLVFIGYNLLMGLAGGIDNAAHLGGLVSGFIAGLLLAPSLKNRISIHEEDAGEALSTDQL